MLAGDKVLRINDQSTQGMSLKDASELLRGKLGEKVTLTVLHPGEEKPCDLEIVRAEIHVDTVLGDTRDAKGAWNYFLPGTDKIAYSASPISPSIRPRNWSGRCRRSPSKR